MAVLKDVLVESFALGLKFPHLVNISYILNYLGAINHTIHLFVMILRVPIVFTCLENFDGREKQTVSREYICNLMAINSKMLLTNSSFLVN